MTDPAPRYVCTLQGPYPANDDDIRDWPSEIVVLAADHERAMADVREQMASGDAFTWVSRGQADVRERMLTYADALANWGSTESVAFLESHPRLTVGEYATAQLAIRAAVAASLVGPPEPRF